MGMGIRDLETVEDSYRRFVQHVVANGEVFVLLSADHQGAWVESNHLLDAEAQPAAVELVFSARAYARRVALEEWAEYRVIAFPLEAYVERVLPELHEHGRLIMPDPDESLVGLEVRPADLAEAIRAVREGRVPDLRHLAS